MYPIPNLPIFLNPHHILNTMISPYINEAKKTLETLSYRNERAMKFEVFKSRFQNAVNILDSYGRTMHKKDVVDLLWMKLNNAELAMFVASIKVDYFFQLPKIYQYFARNCHPDSNWKNTTVHNRWDIGTQYGRKQ